MSFELAFRQEADYLFIEIRGNWTTEGAEAGIAAIHREVTRRGQTLLFVDARGISEPDYEVTRFWTGQCWAYTFDYRVKAAFWSRPEIYNGFGETVALNRGANVKIFFAEAPALKWLLDETAQAA